MTLSIARRHAGTTARSRTFFGLFEHTRRDGAKEDAKNSIQKSSSRLPSLISSNILFCWQDYVLTIPKEEILQG
jgi:hypothetical protein